MSCLAHVRVLQECERVQRLREHDSVHWCGRHQSVSWCSDRIITCRTTSECLRGCRSRRSVVTYLLKNRGVAGKCVGWDVGGCGKPGIGLQSVDTGPIGVDFFRKRYLKFTDLLNKIVGQRRLLIVTITQCFFVFNLNHLWITYFTTLGVFGVGSPPPAVNLASKRNHRSW